MTRKQYPPRKQWDSIDLDWLAIHYRTSTRQQLLARFPGCTHQQIIAAHSNADKRHRAQKEQRKAEFAAQWLAKPIINQGVRA